MKTKIYFTQDDVNLYNVFKAGIGFGQAHRNNVWTEEEWFAALEAALPKEFIETLEEGIER
jgi:hypothetical protein